MFGSAEAFPPGAVVERIDRQPFPNGNKWAIVRPAEKSLPSSYPSVWLEGGQWIGPSLISRVADRRLIEAAVKASKPEETPKQEEERVRHLQENLDAANKRLKPLRHKAAKANAMVDEWRARAIKAEKTLAGERWKQHFQTVRQQEGELAITKLDFIAKLIDNQILPEDVG